MSGLSELTQSCTLEPSNNLLSTVQRDRALGTEFKRPEGVSYPSPKISKNTSSPGTRAVSDERVVVGRRSSPISIRAKP